VTYGLALLGPRARPGAYPRGGFHLYDSRAVSVATDVATDAADVALYEKLFGELEALAVFGTEAREHLTRIAADYRALQLHGPGDE
jgi:hypothetical protein